MQLEREAGLGIASILAIQLLLSLLAITLLSRMGPAIEHILEENVYSGEAVEEMIAELAQEHAGDTGPVSEAFSRAFDRARANVTEDSERPLLDTIEESAPGAFAGDVSARRATIEALRELGRVNRESMTRADLRAKRLGQAGAWGAVLLGALGFAFAIAVYRRLRRRIEGPIEELRRTVRRLKSGNLQARCGVNSGPHEVRQIAADLNHVLDRYLATPPTSDLALTRRDAALRRVLARLLDREQTPVFVVDEDDLRVSSNQAALDLDLPEADDEAWARERVEGTSLYLVRPRDPAAKA